MTTQTHFIECERLYLREVRESDVGERYCGWMNDPEVTRYMESRFNPASEESIRRFVGKLGADPDEVFLAIVLKDGDTHIGNIRLGPINRVHGSAEIGIMLGDKTRWGKGYATEAIAGLTRFAFDELGLHKLTAGCYADNAGSARAFEKAGWRREGLRASQLWSDGDWVDQILLGCTADYL